MCRLFILINRVLYFTVFANYLYAQVLQTHASLICALNCPLRNINDLSVFHNWGD